MLIKIAPDMFCDERYECVTIQEVFQEIFRTQKFKMQYPWRTKYKSKIKALGKSKVESGDFKLYKGVEKINSLFYENNCLKHKKPL
jgi:hypothetical protein